MDVKDIARACHEANRGLCIAFGDNSQKPWAEAPDWQQESAIKGVYFHLNNPDATPEDSHKSWLEEKRRNGWKYGPVKDEANRTHPCFVDYLSLPPEQRVKDHVFRAIVHALKG